MAEDTSQRSLRGVEDSERGSTRSRLTLRSRKPDEVLKYGVSLTLVIDFNVLSSCSDRIWALFRSLFVGYLAFRL